MSSQNILNLATNPCFLADSCSSIRSYSKDRALSLAKMLSSKGLPSEPYPHPSGDGSYAIRAVDKKDSLRME